MNNKIRNFTICIFLIQCILGTSGTDGDDTWINAKVEKPNQTDKPMEFLKKEFAKRYAPVRPGSRKFVCVSGSYRNKKSSSLYLGSLNMELYGGKPIMYVAPIIKATIPLGVRYWKTVKRRIRPRSFNKCALDSTTMIRTPYYQKQTPMEIEYMKEIITTYQIDHFFIRWHTMKKKDLRRLLSQNPRRMRHRTFDPIFRKLRIYTFSLDRSKSNVCFFVSTRSDKAWYNSIWNTLKYPAWEGGRTGALVKNMPYSPDKSQCPKE